MSENSLTSAYSLLDAVPIPLIQFDRDGRHTFANATALRTIGLSREQVVGRTMYEIGLPADMAAGLHANVLRVASTGEPFGHTMTLPTPTGEVVQQVLLSPLRDAAGVVVGVAVAATDITPQVRAQQALEAREDQLRHVIQDQTEVLCRFRGDGTILFVNEVYCRTFGKTADDLVGKRFLPLVHPDDAERLQRELAGMTPDNPVVRIEHRVFDAGGRVRWMEFVNRGFYSPAGELMYAQAVGRDVTDRREAEEARRKLESDLRAKEEQQKYERQLQHAQKLESLGVLAGGIAHDFNNLLTAVLGYASLGRMRLPAHDPLAADLKQIENAAVRAAELCQQMLAYAGRGHFVVQAVDLNALTQEMSNLLATVLSKKAVLKFNLTSELPFVQADSTQVRQVVMNLITNASDAIGERSGVITLTTGVIDADAKYLADIQSPDLPPGRYVYLEVSDTGCGMPDDVKAKIFDPFFTTKFTGRGLGLAAVQGIVRTHRGAIKVYTQPGKGTTFKVLLPALDHPGESPPASGIRPLMEGRGRRVLVVDDEEDVRVFARKVLELFGFSVTLAPDGRAGVEAFGANPAAFDLVVLDLTMPRLNGAEAFREMRRHRADVRVLLTSGFAAEEATSGFAGKGLAGFVRKPFRAEDLIRAVFDTVGS